MKKFSNLQEFYNALLSEDYVQTIWDEDWVGDCPCSVGEVKIGNLIVGIDTRYWRVSECNEVQDVYIHIKGKRLKDLKNNEELNFMSEVGWMLVEALNKQRWYNPYRFIISDGINPTNIKSEEDAMAEIEAAKIEAAIGESEIEAQEREEAEIEEDYERYY